MHFHYLIFYEVSHCNNIVFIFRDTLYIARSYISQDWDGIISELEQTALIVDFHIYDFLWKTLMILYFQSKIYNYSILKR